MTRGLRAVWVLAANGGFASLMFMRLQSTGFYGGDWWSPELWFELVFEVGLPIVGIVLELVDAPFARWVNVGTFAVPGCFWLAQAIWWVSDPFFGVLLIIAVGVLAIAVVTEIVYRRTRSDSSSLW
jgi:hypothetical protein